MSETETPAPPDDGGDSGDGGDEGGDEASSPSDALSDDDEDEATEAAAQEAQALSAQAVTRKIDQENTRHGKTIARLMEMDVRELVECPTCASYGYLPPGQSAEPDFEPDPEMEQCPRCKGKGMTRTGAVAPGETVYNCSRCGGRGWLNKPPETPVYNGAPEPVTVTAVPQAPPGYVLVPTGVS